VTAAETVAKSAGGNTGATGKQLRAVEVSMREAVARIAGFGALAFATKPKKKKA
jgi:hypothetical protein